MSVGNDVHDPPDGGWTVGKLVKKLSEFPTETPVHVKAHTDFGAHNSFHVWCYEDHYDEGMGDGPMEVPLIVLD